MIAEGVSRAHGMAGRERKADQLHIFSPHDDVFMFFLFSAGL